MVAAGHTPPISVIIAAIKARDEANQIRGSKGRWDTALAARVEALEAAIAKAEASLAWGDTIAALHHLRAVKDAP